MEIIEVCFPANRYHATPWDAHVNEGRIDWPPSPWRIVRALLAVGYNKLGWSDGPTPAARSALQKLCGVNPAFRLPKATETHTRHYMPTRDKTAKIFDAFLRFTCSDAVLRIRFDVELTAEEREALRAMVDGLSYLGRAESWVEAQLIDRAETADECFPDDWCLPNSQGNGRNVRLLAAMPKDAFSEWRSAQVSVAADALETAEREKLAPKGKTPTAKAIAKAREKAQGNYPEDLMAALHLENATWQSQGWPQPPGTQWVDYRIPVDRLEQTPLQTVSLAPRPQTVHAMLLAIDGEGKKGSVRPLMTRALPLMEVLHGEAVRQATRLFVSDNVSQLTGKDNDGNVLHGHQHVHYLPLSLYGQGRIDHILVWSTEPLGSQTIASLSSIRWAYSKGITRMVVNLAGMGDLPQIVTQLGQQPQCKKSGLAPLQSGTVWCSVTPMVLRKFVHKRGKKTPEGQIREDLCERGWPEPISVRIWSSQEMVKQNLKGFVITRKQGKSQPPFPATWAATLHFADPQQGPLSLGYASHLGLGVFGATTDDSA
jgi:CRISPR-associated protein Csb2